MLWALDPKLSMLSTNGANDLNLIPNNSNRKYQNLKTNIHAGIAQNPMHLGRASCPAKDSTCWSCGKTGHWDARCQKTSSRQKDPNKKPPRCGHNGGKQKQTHNVDVGNDYDPHCDEVHVNTTAINIIVLTEAWATVTKSVEIGPDHHGSLWCKINTGVSSNVMPLCVFAKLFPSHITTDGKPTRLHPCETRLTVYNGSNILQFGALGTAIEWTPKGHQGSKHLQTRWYVADSPGPAILGLPSSSKLVHLYSLPAKLYLSSMTPGTCGSPATIICKANNGSFLVQIIGGGQYRCAHDHIWECHPDAVKPDTSNIGDVAPATSHQLLPPRQWDHPQLLHLQH